MSQSLSSSRMEAFSDGVIAVIITIMVLELKVPSPEAMGDRVALLENVKLGLVYLLSFVQVGIYWVNHHYLLDDLETISHGILWANLGYLFCLSFIPFGMEWVGVRGIRSVPVAVYCFCFVLPALAWNVLAFAIQRSTHIPPAAGANKQVFSSVMTVGAIFVAFRSPWAALLMIAIVAIAWLIPPRRVVEKTRAIRAERTRTHSS